MEQHDWLTGAGVAELAGFKSRRTVSLYLKRGILPKPDFRLDNKPIWNKKTIELWNSNRNSVVVMSDSMSDNQSAAAKNV